MSGAYSVFLLRLVVVVYLTTTNSRNTLAADVAAVDRIRSFGSKGFSTAFADPILAFFQSPLFKSF